MMCICAYESNWDLDNLLFAYKQSLITVVKLVGKSVAKKEEIRTYIKALSKIDCSLKKVFAETSVVYGSTNVSYDAVRRCKK